MKSASNEFSDVKYFGHTFVLKRLIIFLRFILEYYDAEQLTSAAEIKFTETILRGRGTN